MTHLPKNNWQRAKDRRRGMTLMEAIVYISVGSVVFATAVLSVALLLRVFTSVRSYADYAPARSRLAEQFRADVRAARQWSSTADGSAAQWRFVLADDVEISYRVEQRSMLRTRIESGTTIARERFVHASGTTYIIDSINSQSTTAETLRLEINHPDTNRPFGPLGKYQIFAALAGDHRFEGTQNP